MKIKPLPRVLYRNNPLVEVIAQVRFPTQFGMRSAVPADFQAALGVDYPIVFVEQMRGLNFSFEEGSQVQQTSDVFNIFHFDSLDSVWRVSLCHEFVAITCKKYNDWAGFEERLLAVLARFMRCYSSIGAYNRLGLRYRDVLIRESLGLDGVAWSELLMPWVLGVYGANSMVEVDGDGLGIESGIEMALNQSVMALHNCKVGLVTGLAYNPEGGRGFLIDADFYTEGVNGWSMDGIEPGFKSLHANAGHLFNHCITHKLREALEPIAPGEPG
ncbi:MAG: hypothetical protein RI907_341 [Pseudomonadota bacterium]|jgi:uncharacterized protein (TIGR04255 family)